MTQKVLQTDDNMKILVTDIAFGDFFNGTVAFLELHLNPPAFNQVFFNSRKEGDFFFFFPDLHSTSVSPLLLFGLIVPFGENFRN